MEPDTVQMFERFTGPLNLRVILQPCIAAIFGYLDGTRDAEAGAPPYFWSVTGASPEERRRLIKDGWSSVGKVFIIAFVLDCVFQYLTTGNIAIIGSILVAAILAILPYLFLRGAVNRWRSAGK
ncbi:MAG: hypothetical protein ACR2O0_03355 [Rhizobiaceae bacterium]